MNDLVGKRFGKWTVLQRAEKASSGNYKWLCECDCGTRKKVDGNTLKGGTSTKCRHCFVPANRTKYTNDPIRAVFVGMRQRCYDKNQPSYEKYGAVGIEICDEWLNDIERFGDWAYENGYKKGLTIERINSRKDYSPNNCVFIPLVRQSLNRTNNRYIKIGDKVMLLSHWAKELRKSRPTILKMVENKEAIELSYDEFSEGVAKGEFSLSTI